MASSELFIISIHALREEGDASCQAFLLRCSYFYPRPPRGGRHMLCRHRLVLDFYFYPRPPRGGRPVSGSHICALHAISIHALREEGDCVGFSHLRFARYFYPRPPRGGRRSYAGFLVPGQIISIHALREEGDRSPTTHTPPRERFLSTPSARRATLVIRRLFSTASNFYPRPPRGGRQGAKVMSSAIFQISIHALREEGDKF